MARRRKGVDVDQGESGEDTFQQPPEPAIGHNSHLSGPQRKAMVGYVREVEQLTAKMDVIRAEIGATYKDAKEQGFDTKAMRHVIKMRRMEQDAREAFENAIDSYKHALGMLADTPLGQASMRQTFGDSLREAQPGIDKPAA
jgi:uncharacterized protein (UPF0335 family)